MTPSSLGRLQACISLLEIPTLQLSLFAKAFACSPMTRTCRRQCPGSDCCTSYVFNHLDKSPFHPVIGPRGGRLTHRKSLIKRPLRVTAVSELWWGEALGS